MPIPKMGLLQNNITIEVATWYTGCTGKEQAVKVLEEAAMERCAKRNHERGRF